MSGDKAKAEKLKAELILLYLGMSSDQFSDEDVEIFTILGKERRFKIKLDSILKNRGSSSNN